MAKLKRSNKKESLSQASRIYNHQMQEQLDSAYNTLKKSSTNDVYHDLLSYTSSTRDQGIGFDEQL